MCQDSGCAGNKITGYYHFIFHTHEGAENQVYDMDISYIYLNTYNI